MLARACALIGVLPPQRSVIGNDGSGKRASARVGAGARSRSAESSEMLSLDGSATGKIANRAHGRRPAGIEPCKGGERFYLTFSGADAERGTFCAHIYSSFQRENKQKREAQQKATHDIPLARRSASFMDGERVD